MRDEAGSDRGEFGVGMEPGWRNSLPKGCRPERAGPPRQVIREGGKT